MGLGTMGLTLTKRQPAHKFVPIRITSQVLCECGQPATRQVWFIQLNAQNKTILNMLPVCEDCCRLMIESDPGVVEIQ